MRRPQGSGEKKDSKHHCPSQSSSGALARVRRFLAASLGGRQSPPAPSLSPLKRPCDVLPPSGPQMLTSLRTEAESVLGRSLEDLLRVDDKEQPHGVPSFVHDLCCYMLTNGVDYDILVSSNWCSDRSLLEELPLPVVGRLPSEGGSDASTAAELFRLFLQEFPHPLLNKEATVSISRLCKELENFDESADSEVLQDLSMRIRSVLGRKVPAANLQLLQYLSTFLHQLRTANHNTCPVTTSALSRLLSRVLTEEGMKDVPDQASFRLAEMLLLNHTFIFRDASHLAQETNYSSDSVSSNCDSRGETTDEADLFTPDDEDDASSCRRGLPVGLEAEEEEEEEDSTTTTTTTDTDDFRSPPVSPIKRPGADQQQGHHSSPGTSSPGRNRSTDELPDGEGFISKLGPYGKDYLPSITGLLTSPYNCWDLDPFQPKEETSEDYLEPSAESSCISGEEVSELESEADRDADGSDTEGPTKLDGVPCPHEERRTSERFLHRGHIHSSTGRKPKKRVRRKHSKDHGSRIQSSEEEERETVSAFSSLLSREDPPATFDPTPPDTSQSFSALLSSNEPVTSDRSSWERRENDSYADNWQRTAPHYSRKDDVAPIKQTNWYRDEDVEQDVYRSKFCDPSSSADPLDEGTRPRGHSAIKLLTKNVNGLKRKIKKFEEEFERSFGYRPSHSDKMKHKEVKKYMTDLSKAKKDLKQMKGDMPEKTKKSFQKPFPMSLLRCQESTASSAPLPQPSNSPYSVQLTKETYRQVEECLSAKRTEARRPLKVADLSVDQLKEEKTDIQKALLFYESIHGRPSTREDKELVRPLYDRYRLVKRSVSKLTSRPKENVIELAPILEHVVMDFTLASPQHRGSLKEEEEIREEEEAIAALPINPDPHPEVVPSAPTEVNLSDLHALPIHELKERKKEAREEKKRLRHSLREYEERFERETGRKLQKEDRGPMEKNYNEYKHVKAKLRLLEALLSKHDS